MTHIEKQRQTATEMTELWKELMPGFGTPGPEVFLIWAGYYPPEVISHGINRAAAKRLGVREGEPQMTVDIAARYAAGVMRNVRNQMFGQSTEAA